MHERRLEDELRSTLRSEGDALILTVTASELERRLAVRRRDRSLRQVTLVAAVIGVIAIGSMAAIANGWLRMPAVGADASPSPAASRGATGAPSDAPSPTPREARPVGEPSQAVLVRPVGDDLRPDAFEVVTLDPATGGSTALATIPGSVLPDDGWLDADGPPRISQTGWLAIPFTRGPDVDHPTPAVAIIDIRATDAEPWIIDGVTSLAWDQADKLVLAQGDRISIAWPMSRYLEPYRIIGDAMVAPGGGPRVAGGPAISTQEGARFLATTTDERRSWGYAGFDGTFTPTDDLPPVYQRSGLERPAGAGAHGLGMACDDGGSAAASGCSLVETDAAHVPVATWLRIDATTRLFDSAWGVDGASAWLLLDGGIDGAAPDGTGGTQIVALAFATDPSTRIERADFGVSRDRSPAAILGITGETEPGAADVVAIGDGDGRVLAFVLRDGSIRGEDGAAWFAGWAGDLGAYDPD